MRFLALLLDPWFYPKLALASAPCLALFERVDFVYTDLYVAEMYAASGYPPDDARRKAVKNLRGVRAKVLGAVRAAL